MIIGVSIRDIRCGRAFGALTFTVATGVHSEAKFEKEHPDYVMRLIHQTSIGLKHNGGMTLSGKRDP